MRTIVDVRTTVFLRTKLLVKKLNRNRRVPDFREKDVERQNADLIAESYDAIISRGVMASNDKI